MKTNKNLIKEKVKELIKIVVELNEKYPHKKFTLDGRLVGDLGEIIVEENYMLKLHDKVVEKYDGLTEKGNIPVQIKTTMKNSVWYPRDYHPKRFLAIELKENGDFKELYNGETEPFKDYIKTRKFNQNYKYYTVTKGKLIELNKKVDKKTRIAIR